ncbi:MAG: hypothetical protein K2X29_04745, partial [Candidatus Obscuribacterales bacterium]|nr:hypothetical protein [Candidatus Obscuribacterales bacterium]
KERNVVVTCILSQPDNAQLFAKHGADYTFAAADFVAKVTKFDVISLGEYWTVQTGPVSTKHEAPSSKCPVTRLVQALKNKMSRLTGEK